MVTSPGSRRRDNRTTASGEPLQDPAPLGAMQEPLGSMDRPISRTSDDNDVNINESGTGRSAGNLGTTGRARDTGRGFTTTFAIIAAVLVVAFLIALYVGSDRRMNEASTGTQAPVAETTPTAPDDTTGSTTTPTQPQQTAPAEGSGTGTGTGAGSTAPANP